MKRTTIWLTDAQVAKLSKLCKKSGIRVAELIRRLLDEGLKGN